MADPTRDSSDCGANRHRSGRVVTWHRVARVDIGAGVRSRGLWVVVALFVVLMVVFGRFVARGTLPSALLDTNAQTFAFLLTFLFAPIAGLLVGHGAVVHAHERASENTSTETDDATGSDDGATETGGNEDPAESGEAERADSEVEPRALFVGAVVGRAVVLTVAVLAGFLPTFVVWVTQSGAVALYEILVAFLVAVAFGLLFVAVGIAISTLTARRGPAVAGGVGAFVGLYAWPFLPGLVGVEVPFALLERFWPVFVVGDVSTTLFSLRQGEVTSSVLGVFVATPLAFGYLRVERTGVPDRWNGPRSRPTPSSRDPRSLFV